MRSVYNPLQLREIFHLEFLRWFARKVKANCYALKGGGNLRFFFNSFRYSEDIDLDICNIKVDTLKEVVMKILQSFSFQENLKPFGIERIISPNMEKAKQTETTQRFKTHLITPGGEDFFTKIEFSRRGFKKGTVSQPILNSILRAYKLAPLIIPHYDIQSAVNQKIKALVTRPAIQARDIFDLYILSSQYQQSGEVIDNKLLIKAYENIFEVSFEQFRDTVIFYLSKEDQDIYNKPSLWDEIKLKVSHFTEELKRK